MPCFAGSCLRLDGLFEKVTCSKYVRPFPAEFFLLSVGLLRVCDSSESVMPTGDQLRHLRVRVTPRSSSNAIIKWEDDSLYVRLTAVPVDFAANEAICKFVAEQKGISKQRVRLRSGEKSRVKLLTVEAYSLPWPWLGSSTP